MINKYIIFMALLLFYILLLLSAEDRISVDHGAASGRESTGARGRVYYIRLLLVH